MRVTSDLTRLQGTMLRRLDRLRLVATAAIPPSTRYGQRESYVTFVVIELFNCWHMFSRCLYLSTAFQARDRSGAAVSLTVPRPANVDDALTLAIASLRPGVTKRGPMWTWQEEPAWERTSVLLSALGLIGASNRPTVVSGLGVGGPTSVFVHLPTARNYYAHRGEETASRLPIIAGAYTIAPSRLGSQVLLAHASGSGGLRPQPLLLDWVDDIATAVTHVV